jgi:hypothetical protein
MNNRIYDIEKRLQTLIEVHLVKHLPMAGVLDQIAQLIADALRANLSTQALTQPGNATPSEFILVVHPTRLEIWKQDALLMEGLTKIIRLVASEMGLKYSSAPTILLSTDPLLDIDGMDVRINNPDHLMETQNMAANGEDTPVKSAFLIIDGTNIHTLDQSVTNIGRRMDNHLVVDDPRVSRYHAQIRYVRNHFLIFDLNSTGGTFVNGQRTTQSILYPGDVISLAGLPIVFGQDNQPPIPSKGDTAPLSPASSDRNTISLDQFREDPNDKQ